MLDRGSLPAAALETQILPPKVALEGALLSTAQVASHLCGILFKPTDSVDEILINIIEKRDSGKLLVPDGSGGAARRVSKSLISAKWHHQDFNPISKEVTRVDPFLEYLIDNFSSSGPTSLRRG